MIDEYVKARKAGEKEYKARTAAGEYPFLPALDEILPDCDTMPHRAMGMLEIPVELIAGTKTMARQNSFAPNFMPLLEPDTEFAMKWSNLYQAQLSEGFNSAIKVYEYLHRFYVQEGNKRVSVSRFLDMPTISADVIRIMPTEETLRENPAYEMFLRFYDVAPIYDIEFSWGGAYNEIAELLGLDLEHEWPEETVKDLRNAYWMFELAWRGLGDKMPDIALGDAFIVYFRIYVRDALRHYPVKIIQKRILKIRNEFLTESSSERVALLESADEVLNAASIIRKTGYLVKGPDSLIGKVIPAISYSAKNPLRAAFIYDKSPAVSNWISDHDRGRTIMEKVYGGTVVTRTFENCIDSAAFEKAAKEAADWGADIVFTTTPKMINDALRAAIEYEGIKYLNCSINLAHQAVRTYYAKLYEAKFLAGMIAAMHTDNHMIGYCSDYPIYGTIANINAFAIGAAMIDPQVKIYLKWATIQDVDWWKDMQERGIRVISSTNTSRPADGQVAHGVFRIDEEGSIHHLATPIRKWGKLYEIIIKTVIDGSYNASLTDIKDRATNYWWGMISGVADIRMSDELSPYTRQLVEMVRKDIINGSVNPFNGELRSQEGLVRGPGDEQLSSKDIIMMDWLCENIEGSIPSIDELVDDAKKTVVFSGVDKSVSGRIELSR